MIRGCGCVCGLLLLCGGVRAQSSDGAPCRNVRRVEVELSVGPTFGYASLAEMSNMSVGVCGGTEIRYNLRSVPLDVGVHFAGSFYWRQPLETCNAKFFNSSRMMAVSDYNLRVARRVEGFFGAGAGWLCVGPTAGMPEGGVSDWSSRFGIMPRVGVECWSRLRLTFGYVWTERANSHCLMTVGFVFGGARLKAGF